MSVPNFNTNIEIEEVLEQLREEQEKKLNKQFVKKNDYNPKKYLQASLKKDENEKQLIIRLLPFSSKGGSPFYKVHMHTLRVPQEVAPSGWKTFACPKHNEESADDQKECPFCEMNITANKMARETLDETKKKRLNDLAFANHVSEMWIARCIERGKEDEGVKFWLFPNPKNGGIFQTIMTLYNTRKEAGLRKHEERNIYDLSKGKDLVITIKRGVDGKKKIDIMDDEDWTPLTEDIELGNSWINDETKWTDLYPFKRFDYMNVIAQGAVPYYDKETNTYIPKEDYLAKNSSKEEQKAKEIEMNTMDCPVDYTTPQPIEESKPFVGKNKSWDDDDLPF